MPLKTKRKKRGFTLCSHVYFNKMIFEFSVIASNLFKATTENAVDSEIQHNLNVVFGHSLMFVVNRTLGWSWCEKDKLLNLSFLPLNKPNISTSLYVMLDHLLCISFALVFVSLKQHRQRIIKTFFFHHTKSIFATFTSFRLSSVNNAIWLTNCKILSSKRTFQRCIFIAILLISIFYFRTKKSKCGHINQFWQWLVRCLQQCFFGPMKENRIVIMVDATSSAFKEFLQFFYQSEVTLTMENIDAVARLADKYEMLECVNACASYVKSNLSKNTMIWGYQLAVALKNESLQKFCEENIQTYKSDIFQSNAFLRCDKTIIEHILNMETLFCDEFDLFKACIEWARSVCRGHGLNENDPKTVRKQLGTCFQLIRFGTMDRKDVSEILSNHLYQELFTREELT